MTPGNENIDWLFICIVSYHGTHNVIRQPDTHSLWAIGMPEPKKKFKIYIIGRGNLFLLLLHPKPTD